MKLNYWIYLCLALLLAAPVTIIGCGGDDDDSAGDDDDSTVGDDDDTSSSDDDDTSSSDDDDSATGDDDDSAAGDDDDSAGDDDDSAAGDDDDSAAAAPTCAEYCAARAANCSETAATCEVACAAAVANGLPLGTDEQAGNTLACRLYHTGVAGSTGDLAHCGHGNLFGGSSIPVATGDPAPGFPCTDSLIEAYCGMAIAACSGAIDNDGDTATADGPLYADYQACATAAAAFAATGNVGDAGGDTLQCRLYHVEVALSDAATHCPHASAGGGGVCQ